MAKLAISGGTPAVEDWIPTKWPIYDDKERKALIETLESGKWCCTWSLEGKVGQFGREFAEYIGTKYSTGVNSGTSALNLAFKNIKKSLLHGNDMDYTKVHCPEAERIYDSEVIALGKDFLMEKGNVDRILGALHKLRDNMDELIKLT